MLSNNGTPPCHLEELATRDLIEIKKISHSCSEYRNSVFEMTSSGKNRCFGIVTQSGSQRVNSAYDKTI